MRAYIAHAPGEEHLAKDIIDALSQQGYDPFSYTRLEVGQSWTDQTNQVLAEKGPVILCATQAAVKSPGVQQVINTLNVYGTGEPKNRLFIAQMERAAVIPPEYGDRKPATFWDDRQAAVRYLVQVLQNAFPPDVATTLSTDDPGPGDRLVELEQSLLALHDTTDALRDTLYLIRDLQAAARSRLRIDDSAIHRLSVVQDLRADLVTPLLRLRPSVAAYVACRAAAEDSLRRLPAIDADCDEIGVRDRLLKEAARSRSEYRDLTNSARAAAVWLTEMAAKFEVLRSPAAELDAWFHALDGDVSEHLPTSSAPG